MHDRFRRAFLFALAQRQNFTNPVFLGQMDTATSYTDLSVEEILRRWPGTYAVFTANKTKCVGCFMQQFCTLKDVADTYQLSLPRLSAELERVSRPELFPKEYSNEENA